MWILWQKSCDQKCSLPKISWPKEGPDCFFICFSEGDEKADETLMDEELKSLVSEARTEQEEELDLEDKPTHRKMTADSLPFDKFLDFMEIF